MKDREVTMSYIRNMIPVGITSREDGRFVDPCQAFLQFMKLEREEALGRTWVETGFVTAERYAVFLDKLAESGRVENLEMPVTNKEGETKLGLMNAAMLTIGDRQYVWTIMTGTMERREAYAALQKSERKYRILVENMSEGIWQIDRHAVTTFVNRHMAAMLGYTPEEMIGKHLFEFMDEQGVAKAQYYLERRRQGIRESHEFEFRRQDGSVVYTSLVTTPIMDDQGNYIGATACVQDITDKRQVEKELDKHRRHLEEMIRERTAELESNNLALQELNTTLKVLLQQREDDKKDLEERFVLNIRNLVLPYVEMMKKGHLDAAQRAYLNIIETHLYEIATPLLKNIRQFNLTPREMRVASLVKSGRTTKEIAGIIGIAAGSIDVHRKNIRKKLGLTSRKANLLTYLESLDQ
ncbi:MAG: PAS domain S-box protein [Syntrophobacterales bacterium]|nr:PAS domain S-box protein [Syntrophobacterales bacterium]